MFKHSENTAWRDRGRERSRKIENEKTLNRKGDTKISATNANQPTDENDDNDNNNNIKNERK